MENYHSEKISKEEWENFEKNLIDFSRVQPNNIQETILYYSKMRKIGEILLTIAKLADEDKKKAHQCMGSIYEKMREYQEQVEAVSQMKPDTKRNPKNTEKPKNTEEYVVKTKPLLTLAGDDGKLEVFFHLDTLFREDEEGNVEEYYVLLPVNPKDEDHENTVVFFEVIRDEQTGKPVSYKGVASPELAQKLLEQFVEENQEEGEYAVVEEEGDELGEKYEITAIDDNGNKKKFLYRGTLYHQTSNGKKIEYLAVSPSAPENEEERYVMTFLEVKRNAKRQIEDLIPVTDMSLGQELVDQFNAEHPDLEA